MRDRCRSAVPPGQGRNEAHMAARGRDNHQTRLLRLAQRAMEGLDQRYGMRAARSVRRGGRLGASRCGHALHGLAGVLGQHAGSAHVPGRQAHVPFVARSGQGHDAGRVRASGAALHAGCRGPQASVRPQPNALFQDLLRPSGDDLLVLHEKRLEALKFDLTLSIPDSDSTAGCWLEYNSDLCEQGTVEGLAQSYEVLLTAALRKHDESLVVGALAASKSIHRRPRDGERLTPRHVALRSAKSLHQC